MIGIYENKGESAMTKEHLVINQPVYEYDKEWVDLILEAKRAGICLDEIRDFLSINKQNSK